MFYSIKGGTVRSSRKIFEMPNKNAMRKPRTSSLRGGSLQQIAANIKAISSIAKSANGVRKSFGSKQSKQAAIGDGGVITNQYDTKLEYRRKRRRGGKGKLLKQKRFRQKVLKIVNTEWPKEIKMVEVAKRVNWATGGVQGIYGISLYPYGNNSELTGQRDVWDMIADYTNTTGAGPVRSSPRKVQFRNCHADFYMKNVGSNDSYIDVYECVPKRDIPYDLLTVPNDGWLENFSRMFTTTSGATQVLDPNVPGGTGALNVDQNLPTVGPFQCPSFCRFFTVIQKRKFFLSVGQSAHFDCNIAKKFWESQLTSNAGGALAFKKGKSRLFLFVMYSVQGNAGGTVTDMYGGGTISIACNKTYHLTAPNPKEFTQLDFVKFNANYDMKV